MSVAGDDPLARVRLLLREVPQLDTRVHAATRQPPAEGSPAAADQDRFDGIGSYPWVFAGQVLGVAMDHAEAWVRLLGWPPLCRDALTRRIARCVIEVAPDDFAIVVLPADCLVLAPDRGCRPPGPLLSFPLAVTGPVTS
jgi:hypothetical protein